MKKNQIVRVKEGMGNLYRSGDEFRILQITNNSELVPIKALHLRSNKIYYFEEEDLE